jgi:hypothetical protein
MRNTIGKWQVRARVGRPVIAFNDPPPPPPSPEDEALARLKFEADQARAEAAKVKAALDEIRKQLPSDEDRARWAELEEKEAKAAEANAVKKGEFETLRTQMTERHEKEIKAREQMLQNEAARREKLERDIEDAEIGRAFAEATALFGPTGKTVWFADVAQSYFRGNVAVDVSEQNGRTVRRVIVKDRHNATILDPKSGQPMAFAQAMSELIDSHPLKDQILRGSGKVGAGSSGGGHGVSGDLDMSKLRREDFSDPNIRDAVRDKLATSGGLQIGPAFDRAARARRSK